MSDCFCPGKYCGCVTSLNQNLSFEDNYLTGCGRCPRGSRVNPDSGVCQPCDEQPSFYDWLYLTSVIIVLFISHMYIVDYTIRNHFKPGKRHKNGSSRMKNVTRAVFSPRSKIHCAAIIVFSVIIELSCSVIFTLLIYEPMGTFSLKTCGSEELADWYPIFFNPDVHFTSTLYCTQEMVYPLYSVVLTLLLADLVCMIIIRPLLTWKLSCSVDMVTYLALYFIPVLMLIYAIGAGLLYYSFPYLFLVFSVSSIAFNLCLEYSRCSRSILKMCAPPPPRIIALVLLHWCLHSFAIVSVTRNESLLQTIKFLALSPVPTLFFFVTVRFTDPCQILHRTTSPAPRSVVGRRLGAMPPSSTSQPSGPISSASRNRVPAVLRSSGGTRTLGGRPTTAGDYYWLNASNTIRSSSFLSVVFEQNQSAQSNASTTENEASTSTNTRNNSVPLPNVTLSNIL